MAAAATGAGTRRAGQLPAADGAPRSASDIRVQLLVTYYQCARAEIVQRVTNRDASIPLFLVASGAVFGVAFGATNQAGLLYVVPAFGLGVALIYSQHDHVIGAISRYLATEYQEQVKALLPDGAAPIQWDLSVERRGLSSGFRLRIATVTVLVTLPQVVAVTAADLRLGVSSVSILGTAGGAATILFGVLIQVWVEIRRQQFYEIRVDPNIAPYFRPAAPTAAPTAEATAEATADPAPSLAPLPPGG